MYERKRTETLVDLYKESEDFLDGYYNSEVDHHENRVYDILSILVNRCKKNKDTLNKIPKSLRSEIEWLMTT